MKTKIKIKTALPFIVVLVLLLGTIRLFAQEEHQCGTIPNLDRLKKTDAGFEKRRIEYENRVQDFLSQHSNGKMNSSSVNVIIPTVVHIVWNTTAGNISDNAVNTMINMLNQDYGRTNPDTAQTPLVWQPIAANTGIQFCLAQRDPSGQPTNGIVRTQTGITSFTTDDKVKFTAQGGDNAWNTTQYFNIWICPLGGGLGGYGEFPTGSASNTFGNVTDYALYNTWVVSHESGHCFDLFHIWGDDSGTCSGSDGVSDTPNQADAATGCPTYPALDACATASPGYMFMNYMDYGSTACKNIFTQGQSARCNATLNSAPYNALKTSPGCLPVSFVANDAEALSITNPGGIICSTTFSPEVIIRNRGNNNLTSCIVNYQIDANPVQTYNWSGNLVSLATATVTLSPMTTTIGTHTFSYYTTLPNASTDGNPANDASSGTFNVVAPGQALPLVEGFEAVTFPPTGWTLDNPDAAVTWARTTSAAKTGSASMWFNSINYTCNGCVDIMQTPRLNLSSVVSPQLTFQVAYRMLSNPSLSPNWSDTLRVDISTDCGKTWTNLYFKYSTNLSTITPSFSTTPFVPTQNNWRLETISLAPYGSNNNVFLRWKATSDYENNLYVDDINITGATGVNIYDNLGAVSVYPNPSSGSFVVNMTFPSLQNIKASIINVLGQVVLQWNTDNTMGGVQQFDLSPQPNGIYHINISSESISYSNKIIINK